MQVETYEVEEITGELGVMAADAEALELIEKLGLSGQKALANPETATRQPYRQLTLLERNTFELLFPTKTDIGLYDQGPIPLRVLEVAAHARDLGMFKKLQVWHPASRADKDPVLVGVATNKQWSWQHDFYLLARWGESLLPIEELAEKARKLWLARTAPALQALKAKVDADLARLESIAARGFTGGELETLSYSLT